MVCISQAVSSLSPSASQRSQASVTLASNKSSRLSWSMPEKSLVRRVHRIINNSSSNNVSSKAVKTLQRLKMVGALRKPFVPTIQSNRSYAASSSSLDRPTITPLKTPPKPALSRHQMRLSAYLTRLQRILNNPHLKARTSPLRLLKA